MELVNTSEYTNKGNQKSLDKFHHVALVDGGGENNVVLWYWNKQGGYKAAEAFPFERLGSWR